MAVETVDLQASKMISHFELADGRSRPRMSCRAASIPLHPTGRCLYATFRAFSKEVDFTRKSTFTPIGIELPSLGFLISPDHTRGYSIMFDGVGGKR
jgi:hypothetical protein